MFILGNFEKNIYTIMLRIILRQLPKIFHFQIFFKSLIHFFFAIVLLLKIDVTFKKYVTLTNGKNGWSLMVGDNMWCKGV